MTPAAAGRARYDPDRFTANVLGPIDVVGCVASFAARVLESR